MAYETELRAAVDAAMAAAEILRQEFHRPGGPRGHADHADADIIAERAIFEVLNRAFPGDDYLGEELGSHRAPGDADRVWIVDPNDGTVAYLEGYRGPAVSIALLNDGQPVLGVVFSYVAPNDSGDLFTWAQGHPLLRNRAPVSESSPECPADRLITLVGHQTEWHPDARARLVAPMRIRPLPSIAYRLALIAAGDGDVAISFHDPSPWDFAGGHALLIGAGSNLCDRHCRPVTYNRRGHSSTSGCFGGSLPLIEHVISRRNDSPQPSGRTSTSALIRPRPGRTIADAMLLSRAQGCLIGQLCSGVWSDLAGQPTKKSEVALKLARALALKRSYAPAVDVNSSSPLGIAAIPDGSAFVDALILAIHAGAGADAVALCLGKHSIARYLRGHVSFEDGIKEAYETSGDVEAIGALLGAVYGLEAIPREWVNLILTARAIDGLPRVSRPRPSQYWAVDALRLAERLLIVSSPAAL